MEERTKGAWIISQAKKIQEVSQVSDFEDIEEIGKCGLLLAHLAASDENRELSKEKVNAVAKASNIKKVELDAYKKRLQEFKLIDVSDSGGVSILGITTATILTHTSQMFDESVEDNFQKASLEMANYTSDKPVTESNLKEYIGDTYQLDAKTNTRLFSQAEEFGLIDCEKSGTDKLYFNGNLFKKNTLEKTTKVLNSLSSEEQRKVNDVDAVLQSDGCITKIFAEKKLGPTLLEKLLSIAMYDTNEVSNSSHSVVFLTRPSAFSKFGNPFEDDALDMAKAFVASLMYGMKMSASGRGRIVDKNMLSNTIRKLIRGASVGPCTAIGQDYQVLELSGVVQLTLHSGSMYYMKLLKKDIGQLALGVLEQGGLAEQTTLSPSLFSSNATAYIGPEAGRLKRKKPGSGSNARTMDLIKTLRE